jgi:hypothetical protein
MRSSKRCASIRNSSDLAWLNMYVYNPMHPVRLYGRAVVAIALFCVLTACGGGLSPSDPSEIQPGQRDYPVTNPHPTHVLTIDVTIPPALLVSITAIYLASPTAGGTMESGTACQRTVGLAVTAPFSLTKPVRLLQRNGTYTASVPIDGLLPGRCDWSFSHLTYSVASRSNKTYVRQGDLVHYDGEGLAVEKLDVWCVRELEHLVQQHARYWGEYCSSLNDLKHSFPGIVPEALIESASPSVLNQRPPVTIGSNTNSLLITLHDLGGAHQ